METIDNFIIGAVVLPVFVGLFKTEISNLLKAWRLYLTRPFDEDRDPLTPSKCQIRCDATGKWEDAIIEKYQMSLFANKRGVFIKHADGGKERISFLKWSDMRKRHKGNNNESECSNRKIVGKAA